MESFTGSWIWHLGDDAVSVVKFWHPEDDARYIRHVDNEDGRNGRDTAAHGKIFDQLWEICCTDRPFGCFQIPGLITCTFYLNEDWDAEKDGGEIRLSLASFMRGERWIAVTTLRRFIPSACFPFLVLQLVADLVGKDGRTNPGSQVWAGPATNQSRRCSEDESSLSSSFQHHLSCSFQQRKPRIGNFLQWLLRPTWSASMPELLGADGLGRDTPVLI